MRWTYQDLVEETVCRFVDRAVPDVGSWAEVCFEIGRPDTPVISRRMSWLVEVNVPAGDGEVWLGFVVEDPGAGGIGFVTHLEAIRDDPLHKGGVIVWDDDAGIWLAVSDTR